MMWCALVCIALAMNGVGSMSRWTILVSTGAMTMLWLMVSVVDAQDQVKDLEDRGAVRIGRRELNQISPLVLDGPGATERTRSICVLLEDQPTGKNRRHVQLEVCQSQSES